MNETRLSESTDSGGSLEALLGAILRPVNNSLAEELTVPEFGGQLTASSPSLAKQQVEGQCSEVPGRVSGEGAEQVAHDTSPG